LRSGGPKNIRVNCVAPGLIKTDFARALWENDAVVNARAARTPLRQLGTPEEIAGAAASSPHPRRATSGPK
jgi:NAD(P)-dependent dehydrogenase (short-subunit alcohol dehydrogenase family)